MIIWLSSYPRSGNTFARTLLKNCLGKDTYSIYNDEDIGGDPGLTEITGHRVLEHRYGSPDFDLSPMRASEDVYFLKTHQVDRALVEQGDKVIYIIRNGYSATLSFHQHLKDFSGLEASFCDILLGLEFPGGAWADHVAGWRPEDHADTMLLKFEELTADPQTAVDQISQFSGVDSIGYNIPEFDELHKLNPRFFREGNRRAIGDRISETDNVFFWIISAPEMEAYNYGPVFPLSHINDSEESLKILRDGMQQHATYIKRLRSKLNEKIATVNRIIEQERKQKAVPKG